MDGMLPSSDARLVLLGYEGSGKTCLADTLVGKSFQEDTPPTEGADQLEITITTAANWELMDKSEKVKDLEKQALLETEFFLSSDAKGSYATSNTSFLSLPTTNNQADNEPEVKSDDQLVLALEKNESPRADKKIVPISKEEFKQLTALYEQYDPEKKHVHLWDFAGQQVSNL